MILSLSIIQRARGVYLAHVYEDGTEAWDAFSTVAAAKRWCQRHAGQDVRFTEIRKPRHWPRWTAEIELAASDDSVIID